MNLPGGGSRTVDGACAVLVGRDDVYEEDSVGAHVFRVFIADCRSKFASHMIQGARAFGPQRLFC